jgi:hypothetical protein
MANNVKPIIFRGYIKEEDGHWVAVCIDLNIVAQGDTPDEARDECQTLIIGYLDYVCSTYPDDFHLYVQRPAPKEFFDEFMEIAGLALKPERGRRRPSANLMYYDIQPSQLQACAVQ